jgi:polysaccharide pyruvyl transferase WcaK-like protein
MQALRGGLLRHGATITTSSQARHDWEKDQAFLAKLANADLIVINGEGTLHDGNEAGERLLKMATHPARGNIPLVLLNALYQDNPVSWAEYLKKFSLISARDSKSAEELTGLLGRPIRWTPDLALSMPSEIPKQSRHGIIVGDSVKWKVRRVLARATFKLPNVTYIPTKFLTSGFWRLPIVNGLLFRAYNGVFPRRTPAFQMEVNDQAYLTSLGQTQLHITGRFHGVCLSLLTGTPFLALASTTSKIQTLLHDAGLGNLRLVKPEDLGTIDLDPSKFAFSGQETKAIQAFLDLAKNGAEDLFADVMRLAK